MQANNLDLPTINPRTLLADSDERALADLLNTTGYVIQRDLLRDLTHVLRNCLPWLIEGPRGGGKTALAEARAGQWTREFLILGEALAAYERAAQDEVVPILICDEFDKVSEKLEDMLLQLFARGYAHIPRFGEIGVRDQARWPVVILLSNDQRHDLSSPMRSRCLYSWLPAPTPREEVGILAARCPQASNRKLIKTAKMISAIRGLPGIVDKPGIRESITLLRALTAEGHSDLTVDHLETHLCFLAKRRLDLENLRKSLARVEVVMELGDGEIESWVTELISIEVEFFCRVMAPVGLLISLTETTQLSLPYFHIFQRSTYGTARWADPLLLKDLNLARRKPEPVRPGELPLGGLGRDTNVVLNAAQAMCHLALFGPPGSGKSATFFMTWLRAWSRAGSAIVLDPKGELYEQTAHGFENVYRIDLQNPKRSDRWNFLPACRHNAELAHEAASIILHVEQNRNSSADPFWKEAETAALTAIILHLAQWHERPTPAMIQELVSTYSLAQLNELMMASADPWVPLYWGMFTKVEPKLQGGVLIGLGVRCAAFNIPNAKAISSPITPMMAVNGIRLMDFAELRRPRTAVYVVVPEGDAARYRVVLATLFGLAASHLRKGELDAKSAPVLFNFDEADNIFIHGLNELLGVGRGAGWRLRWATRTSDRSITITARTAATRCSARSAR
ncbi:MAG: type IV secretory system conjugative DNA transfer family protein [Blastocatellia bacterium]